MARVEHPALSKMVRGAFPERQEATNLQQDFRDLKCIGRLVFTGLHGMTDGVGRARLGCNRGRRDGAWVAKQVNSVSGEYKAPWQSRTRTGVIGLSYGEAEEREFAGENEDEVEWKQPCAGCHGPLHRNWNELHFSHPVFLLFEVSLSPLSSGKKTGLSWLLTIGKVHP